MLRKISVVSAAFAMMACSQGQEFSIPETSNDFIQNVTYNNKVDVIFVMDNSTGMDESVNGNPSHVARLRAAIPTLVSALLAQKLDLHVAVVTTSMGGTNPNGGQYIGSPRYFTSGTPNLASAISTRISSLGNDGSDLERGFDSLNAVLSDSYRMNNGAGFLRDDALLAMIALSSEDDHSALTSTALRARLDQVKGFYDDGNRRWLMNFVGILSLGGSCPTNPVNSYKEPGVKWMDLVAASNGINQSICETDLSVGASNIKKRIQQILTDFRLSAVPDLSTLRVVVNGAVVPRNSTNGWDYVPASNIVRFYGSAVPAADASIKIDFTPAEVN